MKWLRLKRDRGDFGQEGVKGKKKGIEYLIHEHTEGWEKKHLGWYVLVKEVGTDKRFNSLWKKLWFKEIEEAKQWCEDFTWESIEEEKDE